MIFPQNNDARGIIIRVSDRCHNFTMETLRDFKIRLTLRKNIVTKLIRQTISNTGPLEW